MRVSNNQGLKNGPQFIETAVPLTIKTIVFVGSDYEALSRNYR